MRWLLLAAVCLNGAEPGYIDPAQCRLCHTGIYDSYMATGMGRSFGQPSRVPPLKEFRHAASGEAYSITERGGKKHMRREPYGVERSIDYVVGSGNHSQTFLHKNGPGRLIELPVSWYADRGGAWHMSPGFDRVDHSGFSREITDSCLFCHNGYPSTANGGLASGIDCQRCHGPGEQHAQRRGPIVNPAKLNSAQRLEVCLQCHLESASRTLPDAVRTLGRGVFSYRPGESLSDYIRYFEFVRAPNDERITVNGAGFGLLKSKCFTASDGRLGCTTCHDPHRRITDQTHFTNVCRSCHAAAHEPERGACTPCHMQKRRTEDAIHVVMTDHRIRRIPLASDPTAMIAERHGHLEGPLQPLYPAAPPDTPLDRLYLAMSERIETKLEKAIADVRPDFPEPYFTLGEVLRQKGRSADAIRAFLRAASLQQARSEPLVAAAELLVASGESGKAVVLLEPALKRMPRDVKLLNALAVGYVDQSRIGDALRLLSTAVEIDPGDATSWLNLGVAREARADRGGAAAAYRQSLAIQPRLARARQFLERLTGTR